MVWFRKSIYLSYEICIQLKPSSFFPVDFCGPHQSHKNQGIKLSAPAELHVGGRHTYDWVLLVVPKGSFATLLPPPQGHAAFGTMPHTLASVNQNL
jgi:hypothetical protein